MWVQSQDYEVVGVVLAAARRKAKLTQVELARRLGKPQSVVSQFEAGKRRLDVVEFLVVVTTIGADPVEVLADIVRSGGALSSLSNCPNNASGDEGK